MVCYDHPGVLEKTTQMQTVWVGLGYVLVLRYGAHFLFDCVLPACALLRVVLVVCGRLVRGFSSKGKSSPESTAVLDKAFFWWGGEVF